MRAILCRTVLGIGCILAGAAATFATSPRSFSLPDHGMLTLAVPEGWTDELRQPPNRLPPTIALTPRTGAPFQVLITAVWPVGPDSGLTDEATIRSEVAAAAKSAESQSVERSLPIQELSGVDGRGFYFFATDRAPNPGEYKYLTQGIIRKGAIALAFTILTNDGQEAVRKAALDMLSSAEHQPRAARPHRQASIDGKAWT